MARLKALLDGGFSVSFLTGQDRRDFRVSTLGAEVFVPDSLIEQDPQGRKKLDDGVTAGLWTIEQETSAAAAARSETVVGADGSVTSVQAPLAGGPATSILSVMAFTAAGAAHTKLLLAEGVDYSLVDGEFSQDADLSTLTLLVSYTV